MPLLQNKNRRYRAGSFLLFFMTYMLKCLYEANLYFNGFKEKQELAAGGF